MFQFIMKFQAIIKQVNSFLFVLTVLTWRKIIVNNMRTQIVLDSLISPHRDDLTHTIQLNNKNRNYANLIIDD